MARAAATAFQQIARTGLKPAYAAANADGNQFANDGTMLIHVKNGSAAPINVTVQTPGVVDGLAIAELIVAVPAGEEKMIGPFPPGIYNQSSGNIYVDWSDVTTVTFALLRL